MAGFQPGPLRGLRQVIRQGESPPLDLGPWTVDCGPTYNRRINSQQESPKVVATGRTITPVYRSMRRCHHGLLVPVDP